MKILKTIIIAGLLFLIHSCTETKNKKQSIEAFTEQSKNEEKIEVKEGFRIEKTLDSRISLNLNPMQKNHQLQNMRSHLKAVQNITMLIANNEFDEASTIAYQELGSTTEMKLMCASFGDKQFENLGISFHKSADEMSEIFKKKNKDESLIALSNTMNYCVQCHATYKQ